MRTQTEKMVKAEKQIRRAEMSKQERKDRRRLLRLQTGIPSRKEK